MKNEHKGKRERMGGGPKGKAVIVGIKDSETNQIHASHLPDNRGNTIKPSITDNMMLDATI